VNKNILIKWKHENGNQIRFWKDKWVGDTPLKDKFPRLYSIPLYKKRAVSEMGEWVINGNREDYKWRL